MSALTTSWTMDVLNVAGRCAPSSEVVTRAGAEVLARWSEPGRRYHTTRHLVEMFGALEELEEAAEIDDRQASVARLAAWFHDAIYDPRAKSGSNEADSAALARETLLLLGAGPSDRDCVVRLILLTVSHDANAAQRLDAAFSDADLWILSAPRERFDAYCEQIREEYAHVPDSQYQEGRAAILEPWLGRDTIYRTSHALHAWEGPARANVGRELARLRVNA